MRRSVLLLLALSLCGWISVGAAGAGAATPASAATATTLVGGVALDGGYALSSDRSGDSTVMWSQEQVVDNQYVEAVIHVRQQGADGGWSSPVQIGGATQTSEAQLVESASGAAAVIWTWTETGRHARTVLDVSTRASAYRGWSKPQKVWSDANADGAQFAAGIDADGNVTVALAADGAGSNPEILVAGIATAHDTLSAPVKVAAPRTGGLTPDLAVGSDGAAVLSWQRQTSSPSHGSAKYAEMASYRAAGASWSKPATLGSFSASTSSVGAVYWTPSSPSSAVTSGGTAAVTWRAGGAGAALDGATYDPSTGAWDSTRTIGTDIASFALAAGPDQSLVAVWTVNDPNADQVYSATSPGTGTGTGRWSNSTHVGLIKEGTLGLNLAANSAGEIALAPVTGADSAIEYATRGLHGGWSAMTRAGTGDEPEISFGAGAKVTLVWEAIDATGTDSLLTRTL